MPTKCLSVFDEFVGLALKGLILQKSNILHNVFARSAWPRFIVLWTDATHDFADRIYLINEGAGSPVVSFQVASGFLIYFVLYFKFFTRSYNRFVIIQHAYSNDRKCRYEKPFQILCLQNFKNKSSYYSRSSHWRCFMKKAVLKHFTIYTGRHLHWSLFLIKLQGFSPATLLKRDSNCSCFPVNIVKFWRTLVLKNIRERLLPTTPPIFLRQWLTLQGFCPFVSMFGRML